MKSNPVKDREYLPGEHLYEQYLKMGEQHSVEKLRKYCLSQNIVNPSTQKLPTRMGVWKCIWRWVYHNQDKAYTLYTQYVLDLSDILPKDEWLKSHRKHFMTATQSVSTAKAYYAN